MMRAPFFLILALLAAACADGEESGGTPEKDGAVTPPPPTRYDTGTVTPPPPTRQDSGISPPRYDVGPIDPPRFDGDIDPPRDGGAPLDARRPDAGADRDAWVPPDPDAWIPPDPDAWVPPDPDARPPEPDARPPEPDADDLPPDPNVNAGWIGGPCAGDLDCDYTDGFCMRDDEGYPRGMCSLDCDRTCPDEDGMPVTFCIGGVVAGGACVQRCDYGAFGQTGCRPGYHCENRQRYNEPARSEGVCVPGEGEPIDPPDGTCQQQVAAMGMVLEPAGGGSESPSTHPNLTCTMEEPMFLYSPVNGIDYRYVTQNSPGRMYMSCPLAFALYETSALLQELGLVEVAHIGTYNCRVIAGTNTLSEHAHGLAIDFGAFFDADGEEYSIIRHWEHDTQNFQTEKGRILYEIAEQLYERGIFDIVLTPNYNAAHDDHLHVDLSGGDFFSPKDGGRGYFGPNPLDDCGGHTPAEGEAP